MNVVQCLAHSIEAHDMLRLYTHIGVDAFDVGGYIDPSNPHDGKRRAVPRAVFHPDLKAAVDDLNTRDNLTTAQERLPDALLDWADVIVYHHNLDRLYGQWPRIKSWLAGGSHRRVIWRTVGQSVEGNERDAQPFRREGLQIVRYSPKEQNIPGYAGSDALIRFYKDPEEWSDWSGSIKACINITQHLMQRGEWTNYAFWAAATKGFHGYASGKRDAAGYAYEHLDCDNIPHRIALGPGSEAIGGPGELNFDAMRGWLRGARVYLYTGTQPASYTLGLIEAMMTGVPVVSIGPKHMTIFPSGPDQFEGHEIAPLWSDDPVEARAMIVGLLEDYDLAREYSRMSRLRAIELFGMDTVAHQWASFLGVAVPSEPVGAAV